MSNEPQEVEKLYSQLIVAERKVFPQAKLPLLAPKSKGVYIIETSNGTVLHVGNTPRAREGIYQRLKNHLSGQSSFSRSYLEGDGRKLRGSHYYRCLVVSDARYRVLLEAYAIGQLCPKHLGVG